MDLSKPFDILRRFREGDPLSCDLFNFVMESVLRIERVFKKEVAVIDGKTKYMFSTSRDVRRIDSRITTDNYTFDIVKEFIYLDSPFTTKNDVSLENKGRITLANRCYCGFNGQLSNKDLSRTTKLILYKTLILPEHFYGAEAWTLLSTDAAALKVFKRKVHWSSACGRRFPHSIIVSCMSSLTTHTL